MVGMSKTPMWFVDSLAFPMHHRLLIALNTVRGLVQSGWMMSTAKEERQCCLFVGSGAGEAITVAIMRMQVWFVTHRLVANILVILHCTTLLQNAHIDIIVALSFWAEHDHTKM